MVKNPPAGDLGLIPGLGRSPGRRERLPTPGIWPVESPWAEGPSRLQAVVSQSQTRLNDWAHYTKNYKALLREIKTYLIEGWKNTPYLWAGIVDIIKILILPKLIYRINIIPVKVQGGFFPPKFHKLIPKLKCRFKVPIAKTNLKRRSK